MRRDDAEGLPAALQRYRERLATTAASGTSSEPLSATAWSQKMAEMTAAVSSVAEAEADLARVYDKVGWGAQLRCPAVRGRRCRLQPTRGPTRIAAAAPPPTHPRS
jgi:hypothetical protein